MEQRLALPERVLMQIEKPARYIGNEVNMVRKNLSEVDVRIAMCFPDVYEIGMSYLGIQILYDMFNRREDVYCERVYSPWPDLDAIMRKEHIPLFSLETQTAISEFDWLAITIQYEMCYTNILQVIDLAGIPLLAKDRTKEHPIVIGGGPCTVNPEPMADFFDVMQLGEGEQMLQDICAAVEQGKKQGWPVCIRPTLTGEKPSTSFSGGMASMTAFSSIWAGSGSCTRMPCTAESSASFFTSASRASCVVSAGRLMLRLSMPHCAQSLILPRT